MKAKKRRGVEVPPKIQTFINSVTSVPLDCIAIPLVGFTWEYEKGDFYHWVELMNHFDSYLEKHVKSRRDLQLDGECNQDSPFPKDAILQILKVTRIVLDNCINKHCYSSCEHLSSLLASTDTEILIASLQTLAAFVKKSAQSNRAARWHGDQALNLCLFSLAQGWGVKEEGLGLVACALETGCDENAIKLGSNLHFEFYLDVSQGPETECMDHRTAGLKVIQKDLQNECRSDLELLQELIHEYKVPENLRFSLWTRLRFAKAFPNIHARRKYICIQLLAFTILLQSNPDADDLSAFFNNEPEFVNELVFLLHCEDSVPEDIRMLAILALAAQAQDRPQQTSVLGAISAGGNRGIIPTLVQKAVGCLNGTTNDYSVSFVEALLFLITVLVSTSAGCGALRESGLIPTLLPLLRDKNPSHTHLVASGVHILEAFMDYSSPAATLFRELGGLEDAVRRLEVEVSNVEECLRKDQEISACSARGKSQMVENMDGKSVLTSQSETTTRFQSRLLLKALLRAISLGTYAPGNATRIHSSEENSLALSMCTIFRHAKEFGGGVFSLAASLMSDLIHKDPTCFQTLDSAGLPAAFLESITNYVLPSAEAVSCIPHCLDALCLNNAGLQAVKDRNALNCFLKIFTSKLYLRALTNETPTLLASGLDELMRHAPSLRGDGVDVCIEIIRRIASIGGLPESELDCSSGENNAPVPMETESEVFKQQQFETIATEGCQPELVTPLENESSESCLLEYIHNVARLLEALLHNADTSRIFVEKKGVEAILNLFSLPNLPLSFGGSSVAHSMSSAFRAFSPSHAVPLSRAVCRALRKVLASTVESLNVLAGAKLFDMEFPAKTNVIRYISSTELYLSLSSVLVRSTNTTMTELSAADVLYDLGKVYREVIWQISLYDDAKAELRKDELGNDATNASTSREGDNDSALAPAHFVNPVSIRDGSGSHWETDSDVFPLIPQAGFHRRTRREQAVVAGIFSQRLRQLARHNPTPSSQLDVEGPSNVENSQPLESSICKSPDTIDYEVLTRFASAARGLYVALGKAIVVPSRRRDDVAAPGSAAKEVATAIAKIFYENMCYDGGLSCTESEMPRCRYLRRLVDDIQLTMFDSRRHTCNTLLINSFYAYDVIGQLLRTFQHVNNILWSTVQHSDVPMDGRMEKSDGNDRVSPLQRKACLFETLQSYAKLIEHLVTPTLLLSPQPMAQMLVQQVSGSIIAIPREPEMFVRRLQSQVLEFVLPVWNHPFFPKCNVTYITSIASILTHVYTGVNNSNDQRNADANILGPPPDESSISMIVEMGFSRERAEEALRRVVTNSVEMAMEWLFSHPEEPQEDDELARALTLSLGNSDAHDSENLQGKETTDEIVLKTPPVEDILDTCIALFQNTDAVAFPLVDLLVTLCNHNKGQDRLRVVTYLINHLKLCSIGDFSSDSSMLSVTSNLLALLLSEDRLSREVAAEQGLVSITLGILSTFNPQSSITTPKWVTALLLVLDLFSQNRTKASQDQHGFATGGSSDPASKHSLHDTGDMVTDGVKGEGVDTFVKVLSKYTGFMTLNEQHHAMAIACGFLNPHTPATTVQAVLQLCARLTKVHSVAVQFLESGGLAAILNLPRKSLFPGFDSVAAVIIRHLLEDPLTLQQAMELEIRHTLTTASHRHNGRVSPRTFLTALAPVILRNPAIFMQASVAVCHIENFNGQPHIVLLKDKEKEKDRDKDKDEKDQEKLKSLLVGESARSPSDGNLKAQDPAGKSKSQKKVPQSFAQVIDQLLEVVLHSLIPISHVLENEAFHNDKGKSKLEENIVPCEGNLSERSAGLAKVAFILKLMMEILLMYSGAVGVVLRRDSETCQGKTASSDGLGHGGLLYHILHRLLPYSAEKESEKLTDDEWREKLSDKAAYFLLAVCIRSAEGRRRIISEISRALSSLSTNVQKGTEKKLQAPNRKIRTFIFLINLILSAHQCNNAQAPGLSSDMAKTMIDAGLVQLLTNTLEIIDLDHPEAVKLVNAILKALEALTRAASTGSTVYNSSDSNDKEVVTEEMTPNEGSDPGFSQHQDFGAPSNTREADLADVQMADEGRPQVVQNRDMVPPVNSGVMVDGDQIRPETPIFMHQPSLNTSNEDREAVAAELSLRMERRQENTQDDDDNDDDDEMDGEDGEEEEDDEDEDEMEGTEGVTHLSPPDTDIEDHDDPGLSDNYPDDYIVDDLDEEDWQDWQENQVIEVRWRDSIARLNHGRILGHASSAPLPDFPGDPFQSMNEIFSSFRRPTVLERWRLGSGSRLATDRSGGERSGGAFQHPLLTRQPISSAGAGSTAVWRTAGSVTNNANSLRGIGFDAPPFYMYDHVLSDNSGNRLFGDRGVGGLLPPLLDFSMDPGYLTGRRGTRSDNRLSTWTDDGQPQAGAYAAAVAQSIEEQYVSHMRSIIPEETEQTPATESVPERASDVANVGNTESGLDERTHVTPSVDDSIVPATEGGPYVQLQHETRLNLADADAAYQDTTPVFVNIHSLDMQMDDTNNQDGLSVGGREGDARVRIEEQGNSERTVESGFEHGNLEEGPPVILQEEMHAEEATVVAVQGNIGEGLPVQAEQSDGGTQYRDTTTIDPTFLEALPEYLRAEVLASHESQTGRASNVTPPSLPTEDIDPEFLAALPPDIQAEVLAQQRAQRLMQSQQAEGQPVDMDSASIIATFPAELREEVLLTSPDQVIAALPPSLLAEAQLLRERAMNQYQTRGPFPGARFQRNNPIGGLDRGVGSAGGLSLPRRSSTVAGASSKREVEGKPLVDVSGLKSMLQLLYLAQPLGKGLLQRLLLNLCAHSVTRAYIVKLLLEMLNPGGQPSSSDSEISRLYGCRWNVVYARAQVSDGVPPLVSRRVLEILTHLSKHQGTGADLLTYIKSSENANTCEEKQKGKSKLVDESCSNFSKREVPLVLLLKLLNQPLYARSSAHLEQLMVLLEVIIDNISSKYEVKDTSGKKVDLKKGPNEGNGIEVDAPGTLRQEGDLRHDQTSQNESSSHCEVNLNGQSQQLSTSATEQATSISEIVTALPEAELCKLCRLLAQEGLSDVAYSRVAEVIKKLAHIAVNHRRLLKEELEDAAQALTDPAIIELNRLGCHETMILSSSSMVGAAILRILQCVSSITAEGSENADTEFLDQEEVSTTWKLKAALEPLWQALSSCILRLENCLGNSSAGAVIAANASGGGGVVSPLPPETHRVLPFVEALFVLSEKLRESSVATHVEPGIATAREVKEAAGSSVSFQMRSEGDMPFLKFSEKHRRMLNAFLRQNHALLEKSFSLLLKAPRLIDFDNKRAYFRGRIRQQHEQQHYSPLRICVRRPYVLEDSYNQLRMRTVEELKGRLTVQFQGEEGIDAGGLTREWYQLLSRVIFDKGALLFTTVGNESTFQPNPNSVYQTEHLSYFKFVGRVVAKALFDGQLLDVYFTRSFYKHILGVKVTYHDIEAVDPDYYKNLKWMLENDISDVVGVFFSVDADEEKHILYEKAEVTDVELIPGGRNIRVTEENKHEYVDLNAEHKLTTAIRPQINAFLEGFNELVNRDLISIFNDKELELLISGLPEIDLDDLRANTEYTGYTAASPVVQWFWEVVRDFSKEDMARLLQFITGTSKVPLEGFRALQGISGPQRCQIHKAYGAPERLPTAHTCFNQLDLPEYSSKEQLRERLLLAIHEASEGFGFG